MDAHLAPQGAPPFPRPAAAMTLASPYADVHIPDTLSLPHFVLSRAAQYGDRVALVDGLTRRQITYRPAPAQGCL